MSERSSRNAERKSADAGVEGDQQHVVGTRGESPGVRHIGCQEVPLLLEQRIGGDDVQDHVPIGELQDVDALEVDLPIIGEAQVIEGSAPVNRLADDGIRAGFEDVERHAVNAGHLPTLQAEVKHIRAALVSEPLGKPEPATEHTRHWGAFCAASVEFLCDRYEVPCPEWVYDPCYTLSTPWYGDNIINLADAVVLQHRIKATPTPFARRNVFCGNRLFQNKYEMYEWVQEARFKGMSNPREIWRYARQKETALHGA